jgi:hypothetical protein
MDSSNGSGGREPRGDVGFNLSRPAGSFVRTVREALLEPAGFFRRLSGERGVSWSLVVFVLVCVLISAPLALLVAPIDPLAGNEAGFGESFANAHSSEEAAVGLVMMGAIFLVVAPLSLLLGLFLSAMITYILVWIFEADQRWFLQHLARNRLHLRYNTPGLDPGGRSPRKPLRSLPDLRGYPGDAPDDERASPRRDRLAGRLVRGH